MRALRSRSRKGFTLIELMVVVAIIGILAAVALPAYQDYTDTAYGAEVLQMVQPYREMVQEFYSHKGRFPRDNADLGIPEPDLIRSRTVARLYVRGPRIVAEVEPRSGPRFPDGRYEVVACIVPDSPASPLRWDCASDTVQTPYVLADGSAEDE